MKFNLSIPFSTPWKQTLAEFKRNMMEASTKKRKKIKKDEISTVSGCTVSSASFSKDVLWTDRRKERHGNNCACRIPTGDSWNHRHFCQIYLSLWSCDQKESSINNLLNTSLSDISCLYYKQTVTKLWKTDNSWQKQEQ